MATDIWIELPGGSGGSSGVSSLNGLTGNLSLVAGAGISITPSGSNITITNTGAMGTVTSVALTDSTNTFNITGSPVTNSGTLTLSTFKSQSANTFLAAPNGSAGAPTFRLVVPTDIPILNQNTTGTASNITATSNSTLTTLSALSLPLSQTTGVLTSAQGGTGINNSFNLTIAGTASINGTNTGDITLAAVGSTPNANAASLSGQVLNLQPASGSFPGLVSTTTQTFAGNKTFTGSTIDQNIEVNGTAGAGYVQYDTQSVAPSTPTGAFKLYADASNRLAWKGTNGFVRVFDGTANTADRTYTLQDSSGTLALLETTQTFSGVNTFTGNTFVADATTSELMVGVVGSTAIHDFNGGIEQTTRTITGNLTVDTTTTDYIILCNQSGAITVTLPAPTNGRILFVKDISGTAGTNNISIAQHATETIEGLAATYVMRTNFGSVQLTSDGTNWWVL